ncbi:glycoside hydrolase family 16 protein [Sphingomonas sp. SM33]|uniref:Glycoside hydrolase family 16 protein n=1 Tax=Sphingomonas telluris TaxID=2907998 RepID=A0ABS9VKN0_9SPHN|nr:glycoside hydrolase family 16 protein [Sphingomonas telluris]MCH8615273.1 glycoside hydrolase family 16 protein [Sphingomonas telluris]
MSPLMLLLLAGQSTFTVTNASYDGRVERPADARLVWADEFEGHALDQARWVYDTAFNKQGWFNKERQYYSAGRPENIRVANGVLTIEARHEKLDPAKFPDWGGQDYTSARIYSKGPGWTYGFYEVRAKLPCARGSWPAIWMLPVDMKTWPDDGEIDIMEQVGAEPNLIYASLHTGLFNHVKKTQRSAQKLLPTSCSEFHRYQLDWRPDSITIGVDDRGILRVRNDQPGGKGAWPFDTPFKMILNLAIGGDWAGAKGIDDAAMPQRMEVDYFRVWQVAPGERG